MIAIVNSGIANVQSVANALEAVGATARITTRADDIRDAGRIVLPGVGAFGDGMQKLRERGLIDVLREQAVDRGKPLLGICLGMQLLTEVSSEHGTNAGLGWIAGRTGPLRPRDPDRRIPHVGWNDCVIVQRQPLFSGLPDTPTFYFVHSYRVHLAEDGDVAATCDYGGPFVAALARENLLAVQFHPEKSHSHGLAVLKNFANWRV